MNKEINIGDWVEVKTQGDENRKGKSFFYHGQLKSKNEDGFCIVYDVYSGKIAVPINNIARIKKMSNFWIRWYSAEKTFIEDMRNDYKKIGLIKGND